MRGARDQGQTNVSGFGRLPINLHDVRSAPPVLWREDKAAGRFLTSQATFARDQMMNVTMSVRVTQ